MKISHIGIIPDGNRRWAKVNDHSLLDTYNKFTKHICNIISELDTMNISQVSVYIISKDNLLRDKEDVESVIEASNLLLSDMFAPIIESINAKIKCIGDVSLLGEKTLLNAKRIENETANNSGILVNLLLAYDPIDEINRAIETHCKLNFDHLDVKNNVDLVIRSGGGP